MPSLVEDLVTGLLNPGVNSSTLTFVNVVGVLLIMICPLFLAAGSTATMLMLPIPFLAVGLLVSLNWYVAQLGAAQEEENHAKEVGQATDSGDKKKPETVTAAGVEHTDTEQPNSAEHTENVNSPSSASLPNPATKNMQPAAAEEVVNLKRAPQCAPAADSHAPNPIPLPAPVPMVREADSPMAAAHTQPSTECAATQLCVSAPAAELLPSSEQHQEQKRDKDAEKTGDSKQAQVHAAAAAAESEPVKLPEAPKDKTASAPAPERAVDSTKGADVPPLSLEHTQPAVEPTTQEENAEKAQHIEKAECPLPVPLPASETTPALVPVSSASSSDHAKPAEQAGVRENDSEKEQDTHKAPRAEEEKAKSTMETALQHTEQAQPEESAEQKAESVLPSAAMSCASSASATEVTQPSVPDVAAISAATAVPAPAAGDSTHSAVHPSSSSSTSSSSSAAVRSASSSDSVSRSSEPAVSTEQLTEKAQQVTAEKEENAEKQDTQTTDSTDKAESVPVASPRDAAPTAGKAACECECGSPSSHADEDYYIVGEDDIPATSLDTSAL